MTPAPVLAHTEIATAHASRYLQQLCKHFAHKLPVEFDPAQGSIAFGPNQCRLAADEARLRIELTVPDAEEMPRLQDAVVRHLVRFAFREELAVAWRNG